MVTFIKTTDTDNQSWSF